MDNAKDEGFLVQEGLSASPDLSVFNNVSFDYLNAAGTHHINPIARPFLQQAAEYDPTSLSAVTAVTAGSDDQTPMQPQYHNQLIEQIRSNVYPQTVYQQNIQQPIVPAANVSSTTYQIGSNTTGLKSRNSNNTPCTAEVAPDIQSESELRRKGTVFLRTHAAQHGVINASRKKLELVARELSQHYLSAHAYALVQDVAMNTVAGEPGEIQRGPTVVHLQPVVAVKSKPPPPIPTSSIGVVSSSSPQSQDKRALNATTSNCQPKKRVKGQQAAATGCQTAIVARSKSELKLLSTSRLRPHASLHKILNASRRNKQDVVEELWQHYEKFHAKDLQECMDAGGLQGPSALHGLPPPAPAMTEVNVPSLIQAAPPAQLSYLTPSAPAVVNSSAWVGHVADDDEENTLNNWKLKHNKVKASAMMTGSTNTNQSAAAVVATNVQQLQMQVATSLQANDVAAAACRQLLAQGDALLSMATTSCQDPPSTAGVSSDLMTSTAAKDKVQPATPLPSKLLTPTSPKVTSKDDCPK